MAHLGRQGIRLAAVSPALNKVMRISIVCYSGKEVQLKKTLASLLVACILPLRKQLLRAVDIVLVNNGPTNSERTKIEALLEFGRSLAEPEIHLSIVGDGYNLGFGAGHNLAFNPSDSDFHLVLNPDVELAPDALALGLEFMVANEDCGIIAPAIYDRDGNRQYLCKRYPSVFDLLIRGFAPGTLRRLFERRLASYEMRDLVSEVVVWNPPIISGCFMLLRSSLLQQIKGFDPQYFLYFEDFDLSLRAAKMTKIAYVPSVQIIHYGGHAARKGLRHIFLFIQSAIKFFNCHGWKWV
jgi:GT2 family glycosyltransferase